MKKQGTIIAHYGVAVDVRFTDGSVVMVRVKRNSGHVVGDDVVVEGEILRRLSRRTEICRMDARRGMHVVGVNLDILCIVVACEPLPPPGFIDRAVVAARNAKLRPLLIVNKTDLACAKGYVDYCRSEFAVSLPVFELSAATESGFSRLVDFFSAGYRGTFVGTTGVGKSSILNVLVPSLALATGEISQNKKRGRHTTTVSTLHALPQGGEVIDSPGFNDFGLVDITPVALASFFPGFEVVDTSCHFRDCSHRQEPGCAVTGALTAGKILHTRYATYLQLLEEVEGMENNVHYRQRRKRRKK